MTRWRFLLSPALWAFSLGDQSSSCDIYQYVRFWNRFPSRNDEIMSPARNHGPNVALTNQKFVVFQPDGGAWNNIRMAFETAIVFAHITGRTLVLPPPAAWYLLDRDEKDNVSKFSKFFDLSKIPNIDIISMGQFLDGLALPGLLKQHLTRSSLEELKDKHRDKLWQYLGQACYVREWSPDTSFMAFNITKSSVGSSLLFGPVDNSSTRLQKFAFGRQMILYDAAMHTERCIFFPGDYRDKFRLLTHFYAYLFLVDDVRDRAYKRMVRDRLHYRDVIFCAAGRAVRLLHHDAAALSGKHLQTDSAYVWKTGGGNASREDHATYFAMHIRRGDFQYEQTRQDAEIIWSNVKHLLNPLISPLLYIATDEKNRSFFAPFMVTFNVRFLSDIALAAKLGKGTLNQNYMGMVEQVICANAHTFIGTPFSTFTGYITRMRGHYRDGRYARTYYFMPEYTRQLQLHPDLHLPLWAREFAVAHHDLDDDVTSAAASRTSSRRRRLFSVADREFLLFDSLQS